LAVEAVQAEASGMLGVVTAEEHSVIGGLGAAITRALRGSALPIEYVGINDLFGISGESHAELLEYYGLTTAALVRAVERVRCAVAPARKAA